MPSNNFDNPPIRDPIANTSNGHLAWTWELWFSSFFDALIQQLFTWEIANVEKSPLNSNTGFIVNSASLTLLNLPEDSSVGDVIEIVAVGSSAWQITQNKNQTIQHLGGFTTIGTGTVSSSGSGVCIEMICVVSNLNWVIKNVEGAIIIV